MITAKPYVVAWLYEGNRFWISYATYPDARAHRNELEFDPSVSEAHIEVNLGSRIPDHLPPAE